MQLDRTVHKGEAGKPVVIFIHGLGMNKHFWTDPTETKVLGKNIAMKYFGATKPRTCSLTNQRKLSAGTIPKSIVNLWIAVIENGYNALCWSQRRPIGPMHAAVKELDAVIEYAKKIFPDSALVIVGHSRGGLIARKYLEKKCPRLKALVTISTPHRGSALARLQKLLSPLAPLLKKILPKQTHGMLAEAMKNFHELLTGPAIRELLPDSEFIRNLKDSPSHDVMYISFGGIKARILTVYKWQKKDQQYCPSPLLAVPDSLIRLVPDNIVPDEIRNGKGDFMVRAKSSVMPWASEHYNVRANHISITWNRRVVQRTLELIEQI